MSAAQEQTAGDRCSNAVSMNRSKLSSNEEKTASESPESRIKDRQADVTQTGKGSFRSKLRDLLEVLRSICGQHHRKHQTTKLDDLFWAPAIHEVHICLLSQKECEICAVILKDRLVVPAQGHV